MTDPLEYFYNETGFNRNLIREWVIGEKYVAIMHNSGNIGVCAILGTKMDDKLMKNALPDLNKPSHRILLNAWFNSIYNYQRQYTDIKDIFDRVDFSNHGEIVMIGYFETLYKKFSGLDIKLKVFDIHKDSSILSNLKQMKNSLSKAKTIILTGTSIFNNTFFDIISQSPDNSNIFLLGPSNILSEGMFRYRNIRLIFGSVFENADMRVLQKISDGQGTKGFLSYLNKVYIKSEKSDYEF